MYVLKGMPMTEPIRPSWPYVPLQSLHALHIGDSAYTALVQAADNIEYLAATSGKPRVEELINALGEYLADEQIEDANGAVTTVLRQIVREMKR